MQLTVDLADDIVEKLRAHAREMGKPMEFVIPSLLRKAMDIPEPPFRVRARNLGQRPGVNFDCIGRLLDELDELDGK